MGKKIKGESKGKKGKKKGKESIMNKPKRPQIDPDLLKELEADLRDVFRFWNGDVYVGHFTLTSEGHILRSGRGKYFTADGCILSGWWEEDVLVEAEKISFSDGSWYSGPLENEGYSGPGKYGLPQLGALECGFEKGRPLGMATLIDIDGNKWQGEVVHNSLTLVPRNHFFDSEDAIGKTKEKT